MYIPSKDSEDSFNMGFNGDITPYHPVQRQTEIESTFTSCQLIIMVASSIRSIFSWYTC